MKVLEILDWVSRAVPRLNVGGLVMGSAKRRRRVEEEEPERKAEREREWRAGEIRSKERMDTYYLQGMVDEGIFRLATGAEYTQWIRGYCAAGGKIFRHVDESLSDYQAMHYRDFGQFLIAQRSFSLRPIEALHVDIIVPSDVRYLGGDPGAACLLFIDGYRLQAGKGDYGRIGPSLFNDAPELVEQWRNRGPICGIAIPN
jgi:hypothetical protein